jgi:CMP-2-keto-3-deoxyoctulosonic acid synthetase
MSEICFCIPARYKSTRLHNKLLLKFGDETCIVKTVKQVLKSKYADSENVYVLTDNTLIRDELTSLDCNVIMTSENYCNGTERISKNLDLVPEKYSIIILKHNIIILLTYLQIFSRYMFIYITFLSHNKNIHTLFF